MVVMIITTSEGKIVSYFWYLDTDCFSHMIVNRDWLVDFNPSKKNSNKCACNKSIMAAGMGNIML